MFIWVHNVKNILELEEFLLKRLFKHDPCCKNISVTFLIPFNNMTNSNLLAENL